MDSIYIILSLDLNVIQAIAQNGWISNPSANRTYIYSVKMQNYDLYTIFLQSLII
jgi:hypothetical protein